MNRLRFVPFYPERFIAHPFKVLPKFFFGDASQEARVRDLVAVEMQDRKNGTIASGIQEFVTVPTGCQRARFCFAIADHTRNDQVGIVKRCSVRMTQGIT